MKCAREEVIKMIEKSYFDRNIGTVEYEKSLKVLKQAETGHELLYYITILGGIR